MISVCIYIYANVIACVYMILVLMLEKTTILIPISIGMSSRCSGLIKGSLDDIKSPCPRGRFFSEARTFPNWFYTAHVCFTYIAGGECKPLFQTKHMLLWEKLAPCVSCVTIVGLKVWPVPTTTWSTGCLEGKSEVQLGLSNGRADAQQRILGRWPWLGWKAKPVVGFTAGVPTEMSPLIWFSPWLQRMEIREWLEYLDISCEAEAALTDPALFNVASQVHCIMMTEVSSRAPRSHFNL